MRGSIWEVVGGAEKGGILVRVGHDKTSDPLPERLATGALVRGLSLVDGRLQFERLTGTGPAAGWVSITVSDKVLLVKTIRVWNVVGGGNKGGIVVRTGQDTSSPMCADRLATGALVRELVLEGGRLQYQRLTGMGPATGWVSLRLETGKELLVRANGDFSEDSPSDTPTAGTGTGAPDGPGCVKENGTRGADKVEEWNPYAILGIRPDATDAAIRSAFRKASLRVHPDHCPGDPEAAVKFQMLMETKDFLLDPRKRRAYNLSHGLLQQTVNVKWWSTWDEIFDEIDPLSEESNALESMPAAVAAPGDVRIDIVLLGATGITGMLACMALHRQGLHHSWAVAGRKRDRLARLEDKFGRSPLFRGTFIVDTAEGLDQMARSARVVVDFTGPKFLVGTAAAEACIRAGTHYIDTTGCAGDALAAAQARERLDTAAKAAGVSLMFFCGWSSVQVDFGVWRIVRHLRETMGLTTARVNAYRWFQGQGCWGGTHLLAYRGQDNFEKEMTQAGGPFFLGGVRPGGPRKEEEDEKSAVFDGSCSGMWVAMDSPPDNVVPRCSCELFDDIEPYGSRFLFKNWGLWPDKHSGSMAILSNKFLRAGYENAVRDGKIPPPGCGAKERIRQETCVTFIFAAEADITAKGEGPSGGEEPPRAYGVLTTGPGGMGDPYECTAEVAVEAARCALETLDLGGQAALRPGFGTPTYHLAHLGLFERLLAKGNSWTVEDGPPPRELFRNVVASAASITG